MLVVLLALVPLAFASAVVRYRLMDVEIILKRLLIYTSAVAAIVAISLAREISPVFAALMVTADAGSRMGKVVRYKPLVEAIQKHGEAVFGEAIPAMGTPLYTDVRLYGEAGVPGVIYGAGPRTVLESHAKRADERLELEDLRRATKVVARTLYDLLSQP